MGITVGTDARFKRRGAGARRATRRRHRKRPLSGTPAREGNVEGRACLHTRGSIQSRCRVPEPSELPRRRRCHRVSHARHRPRHLGDCRFSRRRSLRTQRLRAGCHQSGRAARDVIARGSEDTVGTAGLRVAEHASRCSAGARRRRQPVGVAHDWRPSSGRASEDHARRARGFVHSQPDARQHADFVDGVAPHSTHTTAQRRVRQFNQYNYKYSQPTRLAACRSIALRRAPSPAATHRANALARSNA